MFLGRGVGLSDSRSRSGTGSPGLVARCGTNGDGGSSSWDGGITKKLSLLSERAMGMKPSGGHAMP